MEHASSGWPPRPTAVDVELCHPRKSSSACVPSPAPTRGASSVSSPVQCFEPIACHGERSIGSSLIAPIRGGNITASAIAAKRLREDVPEVFSARSVLDRHDRRNRVGGTGVGAGVAAEVVPGSNTMDDMSAFREELRRFELERAVEATCAPTASASSLQVSASDDSKAGVARFNMHTSVSPPLLGVGGSTSGMARSSTDDGSQPCLPEAPSHSPQLVGKADLLSSLSRGPGTSLHDPDFPCVPLPSSGTYVSHLAAWKEASTISDVRDDGSDKDLVSSSIEALRHLSHEQDKLVCQAAARQDLLDSVASATKPSIFAEASSNSEKLLRREIVATEEIAPEVGERAQQSQKPTFMQLSQQLSTPLSALEPNAFDLSKSALEQEAWNVSQRQAIISLRDAYFPDLSQNLFEAYTLEPLSSSSLSPAKADAALDVSKVSVSDGIKTHKHADQTETSCAKRSSARETHASEPTPATGQRQDSIAMKQLLEVERERDHLAKALERAEYRESLAVNRTKFLEDERESLRAELRDSRSVVSSLESEAAAFRSDETESRRIMLDLLVAQRRALPDSVDAVDDISTMSCSSLARLAVEAATSCETRREELLDAEACAEARAKTAHIGPQMKVARDVLAIGTKLWRLQQAQRALQGGSGLPVPTAGTGTVSARGRGRPLYSLPPPKKVGDDIAAQLLTEMSQALREVEEGLVR